MFVESDNPKKRKPHRGSMNFLIDNCQTQVGSAKELNPKELQFII
jgi:hypothetical protein